MTLATNVAAPIVLGPPYSGAMFWILSGDVIRWPLRQPFDDRHPYFNMYGGYFRNVLGDQPNLILDRVLSLTLLYEEVLLPPTDIHLPGYTGSPGRFRSDELLVTMDWDWRLEVSKRADQNEVSGFLLRDRQVGKLVHGMPDASEYVWNAVVILYIAHKHGAPVLCDERFRKLLKRICELLPTWQLNLAAAEAEAARLHIALDTVFDAAGLHFRIETLEEYRTLQLDKTVREYATGFRKLATNVSSDARPRRDEFYQSILECMYKENIARKVSGGFSISSTALSITSLFPGIGTATGALGLFFDGISRAATLNKEQHRSWALALAVAEVLSKHRLQLIAHAMVNSTD